MRKFNLNANQIHAAVQGNIEVAVKRIASCFEYACDLQAVGMIKEDEYLFNVECIQVMLEGFVKDSCYPTFNSIAEVELEKLGLTVIFGQEGCGYITNDEESLVVYFG